MILKPSEAAPLSVLQFAEMSFVAGGKFPSVPSTITDNIRDPVPPGVLNVIPGFGAKAGAALAKHPGIDKVCLSLSYQYIMVLIQSRYKWNMDLACTLL